LSDPNSALEQPNAWGYSIEVIPEQPLVSPIGVPGASLKSAQLPEEKVNSDGEKPQRSEKKKKKKKDEAFNIEPQADCRNACAQTDCVQS